jgi:hypothetical protein
MNSINNALRVHSNSCAVLCAFSKHAKKS